MEARRGGGLLRPRSYFAFPVLVPLGPEPGIAPVPSAVVQTGALPVELINLTRAIDVSLLKRYGACDIFSDISVPSFFHLYFRGLFSKYMDEVLRAAD